MQNAQWAPGQLCIVQCPGTFLGTVGVIMEASQQRSLSPSPFFDASPGIAMISQGFRLAFGCSFLAGVWYS